MPMSSKPRKENFIEVYNRSIVRLYLVFVCHVYLALSAKLVLRLELFQAFGRAELANHSPETHAQFSEILVVHLGTALVAMPTNGFDVRLCKEKRIVYDEDVDISVCKHTQAVVRAEIHGFPLKMIPLTGKTFLARGANQRIFQGLINVFEV